MSELLKGTPEQVTEKLLLRYEPLRDSRAFSEPERQQRKLYRGTSNLLLVGGAGLEVGLLATGHTEPAAIGFGLLVLCLGAAFRKMAGAPLEHTPPEPLEHLASLSQALGLSRALQARFPDMVVELDPINFLCSGSCDGYDWKLKVDREQLKPREGDGATYRSYTILDSKKPAADRVWKRTSATVNRHRLVWTVEIADDFHPRPGQPSSETSLESFESLPGKTICMFTLPINEPDQPGLGHEGRTDFISDPVGLHHPEFVGEQIAGSLAWMFKPNLRL